jgi:phage/plasmid primase-like uncharacterized protein/KaiC/GvpD/RAD55 family RecA-like ATPase
MIMAFDFEAIRRDHPIEAVIGKTVKLRRAGKYQAGCCPFHPDRTPSFVVYEDSYHCFGCGAHGDVIDFVANLQHMRPADAIAYLTGGAAPTLTEEDRLAMERERQRAKLRQQAAEEAAAHMARARWEEAVPVNGSGHPYLDRKGVASYGARREGDWLLVPIYDAAGAILSVQAIPAAAGEKKLFHAGATVKGGRYVLPGAGSGPIVIAEGFATGATVQAATGYEVVIAFSKTNVRALARELRGLHPSRPIIIAADVDAIDDAYETAAGMGAKVAIPGLAGADGSDFNDQAAHYGIEDVARAFAAVLDAKVDTPFPLVWMKDVRPLLNGNWIVKKTIPAEGFVTIIGHPGCGKSFLALDLALHIAGGLDWQGRKVKPGLVVYLAAEGQRGQINRVEAWKRHHGLDGLPFALIPVAVNLRDREADLPKLIETIDAAVATVGLNLAVLVVDTLNRTFGGGDENGEDMAQYVENTGRLRSHFGATTLVVHHVPKNSETLSERGHGSLRGAIDTSLAVMTDTESRVRTLRCIKQKDAEDGWEIQFKLQTVELGVDEDGDEVSSCVVVEADDEMASHRSRGPNLSPTQRSVFMELLATLEAAPISIPRDIPEDVLDRGRVGKVVPRSAWRDRWVAIGGGDKELDVAHATFRRAVTELKNKGLVGLWNDHAWATHA